MSQLDKQTVKELSALCRINCSEEEQESLLTSLQNILNYVEQMQRVDTEGVIPCNNVLMTDPDNQCLLREDSIGEMLPREDFLANAPVHSSSLVIVPPVIK